MSDSTLKRWFNVVWPDPARRRSVVAGYRTLATEHPLVLADIAMRGGLFAPAGTTDPIALAIAEGRRQLAIEINELARMPADKLYRLIDLNHGS